MANINHVELEFAENESATVVFPEALRPHRVAITIYGNGDVMVSTATEEYGYWLVETGHGGYKLAETGLL